MPRPRWVDPATLGPREVAAYFCLFGLQREVAADGGYHVETLTRDCLDGWAARFGGPVSVLWDHGLDADDRAGAAESVPIGKTTHVSADAYGGFCRFVLSEGELQDKILAACRADEVGMSYDAADLDPQMTERNGRTYVFHRRLSLREITVTPRPREPLARIVAVGCQAANRSPIGPVRDDFADLSDRALADEAAALIESSGGSLAALEMQVRHEQEAEQRATYSLEREVRQMAANVAAEKRRARRAYLEWLTEAARSYQHPTDDVAGMLLRRADAAARDAARAGSALRELLVNDRELVSLALEEAGA